MGNMDISTIALIAIYIAFLVVTNKDKKGD